MLNIKTYIMMSIILIFVGTIVCYSDGGYEYIPDENTLGLWHFNDGKVTDESDNGVKADIEGKGAWDNNQDWNKEKVAGKSFKFDGNTAISLGKADELIPDIAITVEAWVYPEDLTGWRLICANWDGPPGAFHLGVSNGGAKFHINTSKGTSSAEAGGALELEKWQHIAGTFDSKSIKLYIDGKEAASTNHSGKLQKGDYDVVIGSKNTRQFKWKGLIDEVRISDIARDTDVLSPNLKGPQSVKFTKSTLPIVWGNLKK